MKLPKVSKPPQEEKKSGLKTGKVKKIVGAAAPKKKVGGLSSLKTADQALRLIKSNEENIDLKIKKKKKKNVFPESSIAKSPNDNVPLKKSGLKHDKNKNENKPKKDITGGGPEKPVTNFGKKKNKSFQNDVENNSSPIKATSENKKVNIPFKLDSTFSTPTKKEATGSTKGNKSPEVILGLELEKALSPKSKKEKKKLKLKQKLQTEGKLEVTKKGVVKKPKMQAEDKDEVTEKEGISQSASGEAGTAGKKKRRRRRRAKKQPVAELLDCSLFEEVNAKNALKALLKTSKSEKKELFGEDHYIYLQCNLLKGSEMSRAVLHIALPHLILPQPIEVCLITPDLKGKRNDPDEAIDFYKELLKKKGIDYISEIIPIRKLKQEYTSFEIRRKLANRFDAVLVDGKVGKFARIGRRFAPTKKCVSTVRLSENNLKEEFDKALRKVAMFCQGNGLSLSIKCGRDGMAVNDIAENIMTIGKHIVNDKIVIGNMKNISSVYVKTALSPSFPIYVSTLTPNEVPVPEGKKRKVEESVEDEVTTVLGGTVVVHPSGNVKVKKQKQENFDSDDESPKKKKKVDAKNAEVEKKNKNQKNITKTLKHDSSGEDSDASDLDFEIGSDFELASDSDEEDSELGVEVDDEASDDGESDIDEDAEQDDAEESEVEDDEETDDAESDEGGSDSDEFEDKIAAAEREYLQEVRQLQDGIAKKKKALNGKVPQGKGKSGGQPVQQQSVEIKIVAQNKSGLNQQKLSKKGDKKQVAVKQPQNKQASQKKQESNLPANKKQQNKQADQKKQQNLPTKFKNQNQNQAEHKKANQKGGNKLSTENVQVGKQANENKQGNNKPAKENKFGNKQAKQINKSPNQQKGKKQAQPFKAVNQELNQSGFNKKDQKKRGKAGDDRESNLPGKKPFFGGKKLMSK